MMMETFYISANILATSRVKLLSIWNVDSMTEKLSFYFLILIGLHIDSQMWPVVTLLDSMV